MLLEELTDLKTTTLIGMVNRALKRGDTVKAIIFDETGKAPAPSELRHLRLLDDPQAYDGKIAEIGWKEENKRMVLTAPINRWELQNSTLTKDADGLVLTVPYGPYMTVAE